MQYNRGRFFRLLCRSDVFTVSSLIRARPWSILLRCSTAISDLGIAGRLSVAFGAVAVLATAANFIVEHGPEIIHTSSVVTPIARPAPPVVQARAPAPVVAPVSPPAEVVKEVNDTVVLEALEQFTRAVERRAQADSADNTELLKVAGARVKSQTEAFLEEANAPGVNTRARALRAGVVALRKQGDEVVQAADARRSVLAGYWSHFESVDSQVKKTLDQNNWKIFGRVISRQSLLSLSRGLDDIRRHSSQLNTPDQAMWEALAQSQLRFSATLEQNAGGLGRSQGAPWLANVRKDFADVMVAREQLGEMDARNPKAVGAVERSSDELGGMVRAVTEGVRKAALASRNAAAAAANAAASAAVQSAPAPTTGVGSVEVREGMIARRDPGREGNAAGVATGPVTSAGDLAVAAAAARARAKSERYGALIAAISGLVLLILFFISVATVRSIVVPYGSSCRRRSDWLAAMTTRALHAAVSRNSMHWRSRSIGWLRLRGTRGRSRVSIRGSSSHEWMSALSSSNISRSTIH